LWKSVSCFLFYEKKFGHDHWSTYDDKLKGGYIDISKFISLRQKAQKEDIPQKRRYHTNKPIAEYVDYKKFLYHESCTHLDLDSVFVELNSPIFIIRRGNFCPNRGKQSHVNYSDYGNLIINPCLRDFGLQSSFEPFHANQEIEMYLGNQLTQRDSCDIKRTDELIRDSKGFHGMSFRKRKE
jgi:hypothetical protein